MANIHLPQGTIQYIYSNPSLQPQLNPQQGPLNKILKANLKILGAIQILIALAHFGFGTISALVYSPPYIPVSTLGAYPYWGGLFFIISGSLSVSAENNLSSSWVKCSVGMNITSAVMASFGIILYTVELALNSAISYPLNPDDLVTSYPLNPDDPVTSYSLNPDDPVTSYPLNPAEYEQKKSIGTGISVLLLLFSLLEWAITISSAHSGCQATCCNPDPESVHFVLYQISNGMALPIERNLPPPPDYNMVISAPSQSEESTTRTMQNDAPEIQGSKQYHSGPYHR